MTQPPITFDDYAKTALVPLEKEGALCSFCGIKLPRDYYLLLSAWRSATQELVGPQQRFCEDCYTKIVEKVYKQVRQQHLPL